MNLRLLRKEMDDISPDARLVVCSASQASREVGPALLLVPEEEAAQLTLPWIGGEPGTVLGSSGFVLVVKAS